MSSPLVRGETRPELEAAGWASPIDSTSWTYSDANESSAAFRPGTCNGSDYSSDDVLTESGAFLKGRISTPDDFPTTGACHRPSAGRPQGRY